MNFLSRLVLKAWRGGLPRCGPGLLKGVRKSKKPKKRRILQCFLAKAGVHDRTDGTNILKIIFEGTKKARNVVNCNVVTDCMA